jgi:hypothetical protein
MKRWAVSYIAWDNTDLITEIVQAETWIDAVLGHSWIVPIAESDFEGAKDIRAVADDHDKVKQMFFDSDSMVEAIEIPD